MDRSDAEIGREAVERYVVIDADGENDTNAAGYVDLVQHIREAIRGDIEREMIERLIAEAYEWEGLAAENDDHSGNIDKAVAVQEFLQSYLPEPYDPSQGMPDSEDPTGDESAEAMSEIVGSWSR